MKTAPTFTATIYVGTRVGRTMEPAARVHDIAEIKEVCQRFCNEVGLCVTVTPTTFVYTKGREEGCAVGLIHYPRFPSTPEAVRLKALELAGRLLAAIEQLAVSVVFPDETITLFAPTPEPKP